MIVFAPDKPLEIWDARSLTLLKELPAQNPIFPAVVSVIISHIVLAILLLGVVTEPLKDNP